MRVVVVVDPFLVSSFSWYCFVLEIGRYVSMPGKRCRACLLVGGVILFIACVFLGSGFNPSLVRICPRYAISCFLNWHLLLFNFRFAGELCLGL